MSNTIMSAKAMPKSSLQALETLKARLSAIEPNLKSDDGLTASTYTAKGADFQFLNNLLGNTEFRALIKMHDRLASARQLGLQPVAGDAVTRLNNAAAALATAPPHLQAKAEECQRLLSTPRFKAVVRAYDTMADQDFEINQDDSALVVHRSEAHLQDGTPYLRLVFKRSGEPLGCTIRSELQPIGRPHTFVARLIASSFAERCGLIQEGDEVVLVNDIEVRGLGTDDVINIMKQDTEQMVMGLVPKPKTSVARRSAQPETYVRVLFDYNPELDPWIPAQDSGLSFVRGDILQILRQDDDWWHARHVGQDDVVGLIPSITLQSRRPRAEGSATATHVSTAASTRPGLKPKRDKQHDDVAARQETYYEVVTLVQPEKRRPPPVVLVGPQGVGRHTVKMALMRLYPEAYSTCVPHTTRPAGASDVPGQTYNFTTRKRMETAINRGEFVEYGEHQGQLYGTSVTGIVDVMDKGQTCLLDTECDTIPRLRNRQLQALVVFLRPPNLIKLRETRMGTMDNKACTAMLADADHIDASFGHLFDLALVNEDVNETAQKLHNYLLRINREPRWVPMSWSVQRSSMVPDQ
eukprot:TRINITY_DN1749_c0_g1_i1.p1 TRINITY_DN1749_c0_g1~~TRINITY_DN1749_c0_g1_i1.p1  ORF type:complete len:581 (+),score=145.76 TRINITY_DN1749_c0_g1_i1:123-1865(+)